MASSINASTSGAGGVITTADNTGILNLQTASTTAVTVNASQNVGIGTSSPSTKLHVAGNITVNDGQQYCFGSNNYNGMAGSAASNIVQFYTNNTERMRIDSNGNVGINITSPSYLLDIYSNTASLITSKLARNPSDGNFGIGFKNGVVGGVSGTEMARLRWGYGGTDNAYISAERDGGTGANRINVVCNMSAGVFLSAGGTSWGSLSDERQKTNLEPIADASNKLNTLRTVTGRYITDEETVSRAFLIAQDVQKVLPEAVDAQEDEDGTLGLRYTDLIPLLIAGFKEQQTIINDLKARVTALEAK